MASIQTREGVRGKTYQVMYRDQVAHQAKRTFKRLADARAFKAKVEHQRPDDIMATRITLEQVLEQMRGEVRWSANTLRGQDVIRRALERKDPQIFTTDVGKLSVARAMEALSSIEGPVLRKHSRLFLNQLFKRVNHPLIPAPTGRTRASGMETKRPRERTLETAEIEAILAKIPERYRTMLTLMAYTGVRPGEAYGLQVQDYDPDPRSLTIQRAVSRGRVGPTKTGETRTIPVGGLGDLIEGHIKQYGLGVPNTHLFTNDQGQVISENSFWKIFRRAVQEAGIPNSVSPNSLRHHAAAWMVHHGANVLQVSRMLGHAKPSITLDVYSYLFSDSLEAIGAMLPSAPRYAELGPGSPQS